jgi:hypothetical protein
MSGHHPQQRCAALFAHPGHELVIHRWVEQTRPLVALLTDGSGTTGRSRVDSTTRVLDAAGSTPARQYGRYTDAHCYQALLERDSDFFIDVAEELADDLVRHEIDVVVADAAEGWNPVHDIWRSVVNVAIGLAEARGRQEIQNFDFLLFGSHRTAASCMPPGSLVLMLDEASYQRKVEVGTSYAELHAEVHAAFRGTTAGLVPSRDLSAELDARLGGLNADAYRFELLRRVSREKPASITTPLVYELYGEMLVARERYKEVIRHDEHLLPIEAALRRLEISETVGLTACAYSSPITT